MNTGLRLKNLAIAYEALSRISSADVLCSRVHDLVADALTEQETKTASKQSTTDNDEMPF